MGQGVCVVWGRGGAGTAGEMFSAGARGVCTMFFLKVQGLGCFSELGDDEDDLVCDVNELGAGDVNGFRSRGHSSHT